MSFRKLLSRTSSMFQILAESNKTYFKNGVPYITTENDKHFKIVTQDTSDFMTTPIVSIDDNVGNREVLLLDPDDSELSETYSSLVIFLRKKQITKILTQTEILAELLSWLQKQVFPYRSQELVREIFDAWQDDHFQLNDHFSLPVIPLSVYVKIKVANCEQISLYTAYVLQSLVRDKFLLPGTVCLHSNFVTYQPKNSQTIYCVDAAKSAKPLQLHKDKQMLTKLYGEKATARLAARYPENPKVAAPIEDPFKTLRKILLDDAYWKTKGFWGKPTGVVSMRNLVNRISNKRELFQKCQNTAVLRLKEKIWGKRNKESTLALYNMFAQSNSKTFSQTEDWQALAADWVKFNQANNRR